MKEEEKKELFADFEAMLDSISDVETKLAESKDSENAVTFDKQSFAEELAKKESFRDAINFCFLTIGKISGTSSAAFYGRDSKSGNLHLLHSLNIPQKATESLKEYPRDSIIVRRVMAGKPTFRNIVGISVLDEGGASENISSIVAVLPVHHKYKVIGSIHLLSSSQTEIPDFARHSLQSIAALGGAALARYLHGNIATLQKQKAKEVEAAADEGPAKKQEPAKDSASSSSVDKKTTAATSDSKQVDSDAAVKAPAQKDDARKKAPTTSEKAPAVKKSLSATELLINSIPAFTFVMTLDGRIVYLNRYTVERLGYPKDEIIGSFITSLYPSGKQYINLDRKYAILEHQSGDLNYVLQAKSGTVFVVQFSVHRSRFNKKEAVICIGHEEKTHYGSEDSQIGDKVDSLSHELQNMRAEMDELKKYAETEDKKRAAFIEQVSYEIRSMLNATIGMTSLLIDTELTEEQTEYVDTIRKSGDGMLEHINNIIDSINFAHQHGKPSDASYNRFTESELEELGLVDFRGKKLLVLDEDRSNRNTLTRELESVGWKVISVGTAKEAEELIAKQTQLDAAIIDMQLSRGDAHDLSIAIREKYTTESLALILMAPESFDENEVNDIASVEIVKKPYEIREIRYRLVKFLAKQTAKRIAHGMDATKSIALKILLVEDNVMDQKVAGWLIQNMGYKADIAENGVQALAALETSRYDIVFMDIEMPEMDGVEATKKIRSHFPEERQPRIIAMTAHALKGAREQYLEAGMDDYVSKPVNERKLKDVIERNIIEISPPGNVE
jgi:PAS domain S-box-containing protein